MRIASIPRFLTVWGSERVEGGGNQKVCDPDVFLFYCAFPGMVRVAVK
jgi:hypothetical protein